MGAQVAEAGDAQGTTKRDEEAAMDHLDQESTPCGGSRAVDGKH